MTRARTQASAAWCCVYQKIPYFQWGRQLIMQTEALSNNNSSYCYFPNTINLSDESISSSIFSFSASHVMKLNSGLFRSYCWNNVFPVLLCFMFSVIICHSDRHKRCKYQCSTWQNELITETKICIINNLGEQMKFTRFSAVFHPHSLKPYISL